MRKLEKYKVISMDEKFAVLQSLDNKELKMVELLLLPVVKKDDVLVYRDELYMIDDKERRKRLEIIKKKIEALKNKKN